MERLVVYCDPLTSGAIGAASNMVHSKQQMLLLDQTKTVIECAQQLLYVTKECGGNPKVSTFQHANNFPLLSMLLFKFMFTLIQNQNRHF